MSFNVSFLDRPQEIQSLIDESFNVRVRPLHDLMFQGKADNYVYFGQSSEYLFQTYPPSATGIRATTLAQEFATKHTFSVLDLGCAVGSFCEGMKKRFSNIEVMGITAADFRSTHYNHKDIHPPDNEYVVGNIENLSQIKALQGKKFDLIVSSVTMRHTSDPLKIICDAYELLTENGILVLDDFTLNGIPFEDYVGMFKEAGCKTIEASTFGNRVTQTKIRKKGLAHLILPVNYDLVNSTKASELDQAHIFYKQEIKKSSSYSKITYLAGAVFAFMLASSFSLFNTPFEFKNLN